MALQMSRMAILQTAAWRALWIKALTFNRTTLSAIRISLSPNAGTLIATCGGTQLCDEYEATLTFKEQKAIIDAMPEFKEYMRLRELQTIQHEAANELVKQMWEIKAQTPEGRRAKVLVLLGYVMEDDEWRRVFDEPFEPFDVTRARDLLIEFVGGEPAAQLRDQFA